MKLSKLILSLFVALSCHQQLALSQPIGSPVLTNSNREFTLTFNGGYFKKSIHGVENRSARFLGEAIWGVNESFDIFVKAGVAKLDLAIPGATPLRLEDKYRVAYGLGAAFRCLRLRPARLSMFLNAQAFRTMNRPSANEVTTLGGAIISQSLVLKYDWREVVVSSGLIKELGAMNVIFGARGNITQRKETKITSNAVAGNAGAELVEKGEYRSGLQLNPFLGIEFKLPSRYLISCEISGRDKADYAFYVGISQTGKP